MNRTLIRIALAAALLVAAASGPTLASVCEFDNVAVFAKSSVDIGNNAKVNGGDVVANDEHGSVSLGVKASVTGDVYGDRLLLGSNVTIGGTAFCNNLPTCDGFTPTVFDLDDLPVFNPADPGTEDIILAPGETLVLPLRFCSGSTQIACTEGGNECPVGETCNALRRYGDVVGGLESTVIFEPGAYDLRSISIEKKGDLLFQGPTELRVAGDVDLGIESDIKSETGLSVPASEVVFYVGGNAYLGAKSNVNANFYVPDGTLEVPSNVIAYGAFLGQDVIVGSKAQIHLLSAFVNQPPVADPQTVSTGGDEVEITLTGSDPEGFDLVFGIVSGPGHGDLTDPQPIIPDEIPVLDREGNPTGEVIQPPITSATVVYTPTGCTTDDEGEVTCPADSFVFDVTDECGAVAEAVVEINPDDPTPTPEPIDQVVANDVAAETTTGETVTITLDAEAPGFCSETTTQVCQDFEDSSDCPNDETCDPDPLTFAITSLPLDGALTDSGDNPIESDDLPATLPDGTVKYTPDGTFVSGICSISTDDLCEVNEDCPQGDTCIQPDSFDYSATGVRGGTDSATVTVRVFAQVELATDRSVTTPKNTPTIVTLQGNSGGSGEAIPPPLAQTRAPGAPLPGATIAGNVGDADDDGFGDGRDDLPGPAPEFISAAVDRNISSGSSSDEATFQAVLAGGYTEYDFETASGFPSAGGLIGLFDGIDFQATTDTYPGAPSGTQAMTGADGTFTIATLDFTGLELQPNAFGFFALDLTQAGQEVVRVTASYADGTSETFDVGLEPGDPDFTPIYFGHYDTSKVIETLSFVGDENDGTPEPRAWLIDDLTIGRRSTVSGVTRIQIEWDIGSLGIGSSDEIESATVKLHTRKGEADSLDTFFYAVTEDRNGELDVSDFESKASKLPGVVMPVPAGPTDTEGTFVFNVTKALKSAFDQGFIYFSIQGRVDESLAGQGPQRGLQIRSTATGNLAAGTEPQLEVVTEVPDPGIVLRVLSLPDVSAGTLTDLSGEPVAVGQTFAATTTDLLFTPQIGFAGTASFEYSATQANLVDTATVAILVSAFDPCVLVGREPGCAPPGGDGELAPPQTSQPEEDEATQSDDASARASDHNLRVMVVGDGAGSVASSRRETELGSLPGLACDRECGQTFANGTEVTLYARPIGDDSEFIRWGGDCAGTESITTIRLWGRHLCTAEFGKKDDR